MQWWSLFWSAFSAIGTAFGALATFCAVVVALFQFRYPFTKKLKAVLWIIEASSVYQKPLVNITLYNTRVRDICVGQIILMVDDKKYNLVAKSNDLYATSLPTVVKRDFPVRISVEYEPTLNAILQNIENKKLLGNVVLKLLIIDFNGENFIVNTKKTVQNFIKKTEQFQDAK